jgi:hypothetical protein
VSKTILVVWHPFARWYIQFAAYSDGPVLEPVRYDPEPKWCASITYQYLQKRIRNSLGCLKHTHMHWYFSELSSSTGRQLGANILAYYSRDKAVADRESAKGPGKSSHGAWYRRDMRLPSTVLLKVAFG